MLSYMNHYRRIMYKELKKLLEKAMSVAAEDKEAPYGYCPICMDLGISREKCRNGNDTCENGHVYLSKTSIHGV